MKNLHRIFSFLLCIMLLTGITINAQLREQRAIQERTIQQPLDVNSKAEELGITTEQLTGILNTAAINNSIGDGDPLPEAMQEWFFTGQNAGDQFGMSVSTAGDVNGDGYDDIIVGVPYNDAIASNAGRAYIYFGGNLFDNIPDVILLSENVSGGLFGWSVAGSGDVNGDGYDDVIVGAPYTDFAGTDAGTFYIFFGGNPMNGVSDFFRDGYSAGDNIGYSVKSAGDVNGDGFADVIVGAHLNDVGGTDAGSAYIYFGGTYIDIVADVVMTGSAAGDQLGYSVSTAGDVNADGYSDVIVGARYNDAGGINAGSAYIYFGGSPMNNVVDVILNGTAQGDWFGTSVSTAGDVNGDGYFDVIIGADGNDAGGTNAGRAYIYLGGSPMNTIADVILTGFTSDDNFGVSVSTAGDVNGDGFDDVFVGAWYNDAGGINAGRAYIYFGNVNMDSIVDGILTGASADDYFGSSVSTAGDVNGDGFSDVIVGAPYNSTGGFSAGRIYLYTNSICGTDIPDELFIGEYANSDFGSSVSTAGDVNGDGYSDFIIGASFNNYIGTDTGRAYIYYGGSSLDNKADVILKGTAATDNFGYSVSTAGDVNGDGYSDVVVGAHWSDVGGTDAGRAYIFFGGSTMNNTADVTLNGAAASDWFGYSVSGAGDVNGDGYADVIVGAEGNDAGGTDAGRAYIYFGGSSMNNTADVILTGTAASDYFGTSVSAAGDVNRDGYNDVIVGAPNNYTGGSQAGSAYIYFGGSGMDNTADVLLTGEAVYNFFGSSVSTAGDVNGDGYSDVIVGAPYNSAGGDNAGGAYIYFGGLVMNNTADVILTGAAAYNYFGCSVAVAGDVNGDEYADVIVGAYYNNAGGELAGRSYIYFGGASMDNTADILMTGAADDRVGFSVSTAGDVNGDGYFDIIVGSTKNKAFLYLSSPPVIKPRIMSVKDIPLDQGGFVRVRWVRSAYDVVGQSRISQYILQRSDSPGPSGFVWDYVASIPALCENQYSYVSPTPYDSSSNSSGTFYFRVVANGTTPEERWYSNIMSGHSLDNLSPLPPMYFYANLLTGQVKLGWKANTESDLKNYLIYRTDDPNANPDTLEVFAEVMDTSLIDTNPLSGTAYYYLKAQDVHNNLSPYVSVTVSAQTTFVLSVSVNNGWNMVSVPGLHPTNQNVGTWWPHRTGTVWEFNGVQYVAKTVATPGEGYWMKNTLAETYNYPAITIVPHNPVAVTLGWNMIGGYETSPSVANLKLANPQIIGTVWGFNGVQYVAASNIVPGYSYWVKVTSAGNITIPDAISKGGEVVEIFKEDLPAGKAGWGRIILTDAAGISTTLYAVKGEVDLNHYELPPLPPEGSFDIRFSSGRIAEDLNSSMQTIEMSGVTYPLTVRVEGMDIRLQDVTGKQINVNLKSSEDIVISDATINKLMVSGELIPAAYALEQNYPNPFNPSTVIEFSLPENVGNVKLSIYNTLGEKVAELVNTSLVAGKYSYQWNAQNVATGMYVYELRTEKFVSVKKMVLIK